MSVLKRRGQSQGLLAAFLPGHMQDSPCGYKRHQKEYSQQSYARLCLNCDASDYVMAMI